MVVSRASQQASQAAADTQVHFHRIAQQFDDLYEKESRGGLQRWLDDRLRASIYRRFELAFEQLGDLHGKSVLDVGCGGGRYSMMMGKLGAEKVVGVDFAENMIELARQLARREGLDEERVSFVCGDAAETSFDEPFDFAIAMGVFDYVEHPEDFLRRILPKVKTRMVASFPLKWHPLTPQRLIRYRLFKQCPLYFYSRSRLETLLSSLGLRSFEILDAHRDYVAVLEK